jgi:hypothetical protein
MDVIHAREDTYLTFKKNYAPPSLEMMFPRLWDTAFEEGVKLCEEDTAKGFNDDQDGGYSQRRVEGYCSGNPILQHVLPWPFFEAYRAAMLTGYRSASVCKCCGRPLSYSD